MNYQVHITKTAEHDIAKAADYIEFVLKVVIIVRFLYQKSNWNTILRQGFSLI